MTQVVVSDPICSGPFARAIKCLLAFANTEYFCVQRFAGTFAAHSWKQRAGIRNHWNTAQLPILCACLGVPAHDDFASVKIDITPSDLARFTDATARERQPRC